MSMQLDRTHVVIRLRTLSEIGDLSMVMIRRYPKALLVGFLLGALPWCLANAALLSWRDDYAVPGSGCVRAPTDLG